MSDAFRWFWTGYGIAAVAYTLFIGFTIGWGTAFVLDVFIVATAAVILIGWAFVAIHHRREF